MKERREGGTEEISGVTLESFQMSEPEPTTKGSLTEELKLLTAQGKEGP